MDLSPEVLAALQQALQSEPPPGGAIQQSQNPYLMQGPQSPVQQTAPQIGEPSGFNKFLNDLAMGLSQYQAPDERFAHGRSRGAGAFLQGFSQGFSGPRLAEMQKREALNAELRKNAHEQNVANAKATQAYTLQDIRNQGAKDIAMLRLPGMKTSKPSHVITSADLKRFPERFTQADLGKELSMSEWLGTTKPPGVMGLGTIGGVAFDPMGIAQSVHEGKFPPDLNSYGLRAGPFIASALKKLDPNYNLAHARLDWIGTTKFWATRNQQQQVNISQNMERLPPTLDMIDEAASNLEERVSKTNWNRLNKGLIGSAKELGAFGPDAKDAAQRLVSLVADATLEMQQVAGNGYSPTDIALKQAITNLDANWPVHTIKSLTKQMRSLVMIRRNSLANVGASTPSNPTGSIQSSPTHTYDPSTDSYTPIGK